jgi:hypothetical protein
MTKRKGAHHRFVLEANGAPADGGEGEGGGTICSGAYRPNPKDIPLVP